MVNYIATKTIIFTSKMETRNQDLWSFKNPTHLSQKTIKN